MLFFPMGHTQCIWQMPAQLMADCAPLNPWDSASVNRIYSTAGNAVPRVLFSSSVGHPQVLAARVTQSSHIAELVLSEAARAHWLGGSKLRPPECTICTTHCLQK